MKHNLSIAAAVLFGLALTSTLSAQEIRVLGANGFWSDGSLQITAHVVYPGLGGQPAYCLVAIPGLVPTGVRSNKAVDVIGNGAIFIQG
jgi:hypothetical protein